VRAAVIAFALGAGALGIALFAAGLALGVVAQSSGWPSFRIGFGSLTAFEFTRGGGTTSTTFGSGIAVAAILAGALNAAAAACLSRRAG
jgi:hypothetical protein